MATEQRKQSNQFLLRGSKRVTVGQKYSPRVAERQGALQNILLHLGKTADTVLFLFICWAKDAPVVGTADGVLENETVGLARRTDNGSFVFRHPVLYRFRLRLSMQLRRYWLKELSANAV